jgi:hypothetical protein
VKARQDLEDTNLFLAFITSAFTVGAIIVATILYARAHRNVPSWSIVAIAIVALVLIAISYLLGRRHRADAGPSATAEARAKAERALEEVTVATSYLSNIDDCRDEQGNDIGGAVYEVRPAGTRQVETRRKLDYRDRLFHIVPDLRSVVRALHVSGHVPTIASE